MKVFNVDGKIKIEADYFEVSALVTSLDKYLASEISKDYERELLEEWSKQLHNPKVII